MMMNAKSKILATLIFFLFFLSLGLSLRAQASETSTYDFSWLDPDKEVYVLQNKKFKKKYRPYVNLGGGLTTSGSFSSGLNIQARLGYFIFEEWRLEVLYSRNSLSENDTARSVKSAGAVPFSRNPEYYFTGYLLWAPFYAKINTFNKILYFDWVFGLGGGQINEVNNRQHLEDGHTRGSLTNENHGAFSWQMGPRFYINNNFSVRVDFTGLHYSARTALKGSTNTSMYSHYDLTFSLGYSI